MGMTPTDALRAIQDALNTSREDEVPAGWMRTDEWARAWGKCESHTAKLLTAGVTAGVMEVQRFRVRTGESVRRAAHFRVKP